ncbi:MAG: DISARM system phospholipase D-like protein DrmC [Candidatus Sericytochromatia bacterium]
MNLTALEPAYLQALADAMRQGRLEPPFEVWKVRLNGTLEQAKLASEALSKGIQAGVNLPGLIFALDNLAAHKRASEARARRRVQAVWSGPDGANAPRRDTNVVLRELFQMAEAEVLIAGYAFYDGQTLFAPLYERLLARPQLKVRMFLHVGPDKERPSETREERLQRFAAQFFQQHWPWQPRPELYYDPRAFQPDPAILHAKLAIVDRRLALVSSANFTPHAQTRNIEAGVRLDDEDLCGRLADGLVGLVKNGTLAALPEP